MALPVCPSIKRWNSKYFVHWHRKWNFHL